MTRTRILVAAIAGLLVASCGGEATELAVGSGPLEAAYAEALSAYAVPVVVLKGIGKVETNWFHQPHRRSMDGGFGLMHLTEAGTLPRAAELSGFSEEALKADARANILGAAAVLRDLFDEDYRRDATLNARNPGDYWHAVERYSGLENPELARDYAEEVFATILAGAQRVLPDGQTVFLPATPVDLSRRPMFESKRSYLCPGSCPDYPTARWLPANAANYNARDAGSVIQYVVIHTMQGTYNGSIAWFQDPAARASAHYMVPQVAHTPPVTQMVAEVDKAWHAGVRYYNNTSIGIENEGYIEDPAWATENIYCEAARVTRWACDRWSIPIDRQHILGHVELQGATHTDPGAYWNWTKFMSYVAGGCGGTGELLGAIYKSPDTNARLAGVTVTLNTGQSVTTGTDGMYRFTVPAGSYTITARLAGYRDASVTRVVAVGSTIWGSMGMVAGGGEQGRYMGVVYEINPLNPSDRTKRLAGATVQLDTGETMISRDVAGDGRGSFEFTTTEGPHSATAVLEGYKPGSSTATVTANSDVWGSIGLTPGATTLAPIVNILTPPNGARLDSTQVDVAGNIGNATDVTEVILSFGGAADVHVPVINARFAATITVPSGEVRIQARAENPEGVGTASVTVRFSPGVCGYVHESWLLEGGQEARVSGATVDLLLEDGCTAVVGTTSAADGSFCLDAAPGTYRLRARAAGHKASLEQLTLPAEAREFVRVALGTGEDPQPMIVLESPAVQPGDFIEVRSASVDIVGSVSGLQLDRITINGQRGDVGTGGTFVVQDVPIADIETELEIVVDGKCGEHGTRRVLAVRRDGEEPPDYGWCGCSSGGEASLWFAAALLPLWAGRRRRP